MELAALGWDDTFAVAFAPPAAAGLRPARVICELKHAYALHTGDDEIVGECRGSLLHKATSRAALPAIGDWVATRPRPGARKLDILAVLPRKTRFCRRAAGEHGHEQTIAANIDTVFLVSSLDANLNLRRIERFLSVTRESGAEPVILLNKADLHADPETAAAGVVAIAGGATVLTLSAETGAGFRKLARWLKPGRTVALLGSSGVGKSTIANRLMRDEVQFTQEVRGKDSKGRHTTTRRELFIAPSGAMLIDTPGMRELQLWSADVEEAFADVLALAAQCRYANCRHGTEAGCAIRAALASGALTAERWQSYLKLLGEQEAMAARLHARREQPKKIVWRKAGKAVARPRITPDHE